MVDGRTRTGKLVNKMRGPTPAAQTPAPNIPIAQDISMPNHSGDHSAGRVLATPTTDYEMINKKFLDDNYYDGSEFGANEIIYSDGTDLQGGPNFTWNGNTLKILDADLNITSANNLVEGLFRSDVSNAQFTLSTGGSRSNAVFQFIRSDTQAAAIWKCGITNGETGQATSNFSLFDNFNSNEVFRIALGTPELALKMDSVKIVWNDGGANLDFIINDDTSEAFRVDAGAEEVQIRKDLVFINSGSGLPYAEIYGADTATTITITTAGKANKVQITSFAVDGVSNICTPDHTNDHITIVKAGVYKCNVSMHITSVGGGAPEVYGYSVYKNNGATEFPNLHGQRNMTGGGGDEGSISLSGLIDLAVNDTIEVWIWNKTNTDNVIVDDINLSLVQVGGT